MDLIGNTLDLICRSLNSNFRKLEPREVDWVILSDLVDAEGKPHADTADKVVMCLTGIAREMMIPTYAPAGVNGGGRAMPVAPPLYIDLHVGFIANFSGRSYARGLESISRTISYFHNNFYFDASNIPGFPPEINKITFELIDMNVKDTKDIVEMLGVHYRPAVFYKVRMLPFTSYAATL